MPRAVACVLALLLLAAPGAAPAQSPPGMPRIGLLRHGQPPDPFLESFRRGLRELGYAESRTIALEYRWTEGREDRLPVLAAELVRAKVDVIVAAGAGPVHAAERATSRIPIVVPVFVDPVRRGLVASLARPGGNITGFAVQHDQLAGKWVQLLKEALPGLSRIAVLVEPTSRGRQVETAEAAARATGGQLQVLTVARREDLEPALEDAVRAHAGALVVTGSPFFSTHRLRLASLAARHRLPAMHHQAEFVVGAGGLMSYGADFHDLYRRSASVVDKVLKGAKPADLPIEQATRFELVINLRAAQALGLAIPPAFLARADALIE